MQTTSFIKYISNPATINMVSQQEINALIDEFPYCQSGQILLALQYNFSNHLLFEQQLKKTAIYSSDRKQLFDLLNVAVVEEKTKEIQHEITTKVDENIVQQEVTVIPLVNDSTKLENQEKNETLEKEFLNQAIASAYVFELEATETNQELTNTAKSKDIEENIEPEKLTFNEWLKHIDNGKSPQTEKNTTGKKLNFDLINKFIQEDPKIQPKKTEFYSPVNMARLSVVDESPLVSETLALIQVEQNNYEEAIKTYQKLSLKNPEKRSYFANQIKILNQKIK